MQCCNKLKSSFAKVNTFSTEQTLFVVILIGLSDGLVAKPKLLMKSLAIEGSFVPASALE
jgi:hypothetical protein